MLRLRRAPWNIAYCVISAAHGMAGLILVVFWLAPSLAMALTVIFSAVAPWLIMGALLAARLLGGLQRRTAARFAGVIVDPPPPRPRKRKSVAGWMEDRLTDRIAWRSVGYLIARLPVAALQGWAVAFGVSGVLDILSPVGWFLFRPRGPVFILAPVPLDGLAFSTWPGTLLAGLLGVGFVAVAITVAGPLTLADTWLVRALLGPGRISELERTRSLAVDSAARTLRQVERDLHDGAQVRLAALALHLGLAREKAAAAEPDLGQLRELLADAQSDAQGALAELRDLARGIHPPSLDNGLAAALESLAAASAIPVALTAADEPPRPSAAIETIAYFCAAELVANAAKHSFANSVQIRLSEQGGRLTLSVSDDGVGGADPARGSGLAGLRERVAVVDGAIRLSSPPGGPTVVTVELPMEA